MTETRSPSRLNGGEECLDTALINTTKDGYIVTKFMVWQLALVHRGAIRPDGEFGSQDTFHLSASEETP